MTNIRRILQLAKPQRGWIFTAVGLITVQAVLQQVTPITLKFVVDELTTQIANDNGNYQRLLWLFALILAVNIISVVLRSLNQRLGDHISSRLGRFLTEEYYNKIFTLPQRYFDSEISGKMVNQLNRGIESIKSFVGSATNFIAPAILQSLLGIVVLTYYSWQIGLLSFLVFPFYIAVSSYSTKKWGVIQEKKNFYEDGARGRIQEVISNIKLVKTYRTHDHEWKQVSNTYGTINRLYDKQSTMYHVLNFLREFGLEIAFVIILFMIFRNTFLGLLTLGEMVLIIQLLNQLRRPLYGMSYILEQIQRAEADSKAFFEVMELPSKEDHASKRQQKLQTKPDIQFEHVDFAYDDNVDTPVLKDLNLHLDKTETVALIGHSGAGKTTLINLILKLYEPTAGEIYLSKEPYSTANHDWIRDHIALVFQDNELFSSTIRENIAYGVPNASEKDIWKALKAANADGFVKRFPDQLDAQIGERGVKLSGGQKQRLQIARAILHDKPILILDEATSSLDSKSEKLVQDALDKLFKNRLVIIIAHRFSTIQDVDRVVVLHEGTIADSGKPHELAQKDGLYSELLRYQVEGNQKLLRQYELY